MIKTILIDDEPLARAIIKEYLADHPEFEVVKECTNGFEGLKAIQEIKPNLIFLDVQMPKINGFEMLELLDYTPPIIFTTAFDEYAFKAFEAQAIDYLLKPFGKDRFNKAILKWKKANIQSEQNLAPLNLSMGHAEESNRIVVKNGGSIKIIPIAEIFYLEAYDDYVKIHTKEGIYLKKQTLAHYDSVLEAKEFVRVHRSFLVQIKTISKIEPMEKNSHIAILTNKDKIPLSRTGYLQLKNVLGL
jgi:two-component system, LytTR family, response regulator